MLSKSRQFNDRIPEILDYVSILSDANDIWSILDIVAGRPEVFGRGVRRAVIGHQIYIYEISATAESVQTNSSIKDY